MVKMLWDREDYAFILVSLVALFPKPMSMYFLMEVMESTLIWVKSLTWTPFSLLYLSSIRALISLPKRS